MATEYLTVIDAAKYLNVSAAFLNKRRIYGGGPTFFRVGRCIRYKIEDLNAYANACEFDAADNGEAAR